MSVLQPRPVCKQIIRSPDHTSRCRNNLNIRSIHRLNIHSSPNMGNTRQLNIHSSPNMGNTSLSR